MSKNINQVYVANPVTTMIGTDLMYLGNSPYGATDDAAILWSNIILAIADDLPGGLPFTDVTGTTQAMVANNGYVADNVGLVTMTLPVTAAFGSILQVTGLNSGKWLVAQNAAQIIHYGDTNTTSGVGGSIAAINLYDCITLRCVVPDAEWTVEGGQNGGLTVV